MFLVNSGVSVAKSPRGATEIDFEIQAVKFSPRRPDGRFYSATVIYGGLWGGLVQAGIWMLSLWLSNERLIASAATSMFLLL